MGKLTRIIFRNMSPLHLGRGRDSYDSSSPNLSSDSLSSALASMRAFDGKTDDMKEFLESFTISSAFPYSGKEFFLPRPCGRLNIIVKGQQEREYRKRLKKLRFISSSLWNKMITGCSIEVYPSQIHGEFLIDEPNEAYPQPMSHAVHQRVMVPRADERDAVPFMFEWTFFRHGENESGLYCLIDCHEDRKSELIELFKQLGSFGIGSDRTVGGGQFDIDTEDLEWKDVNGNATMLLSSYIPMEEEIASLNLQTSNYSILKRGGFMSGSSNENIRLLRRKTVYMFDAGSVFRTTQPIEGTIVNLAPKWNTDDMHPVYRSGRPLYVTVNLNKDEE